MITFESLLGGDTELHNERWCERLCEGKLTLGMVQRRCVLRVKAVWRGVGMHVQNGRGGEQELAWAH